MRLSIIWRVMEIKEGVMRPWQRTPSKISINFQMIQKLNSKIIIELLFYYLFKIIASLKTSYVVIAIFLANSSPIFSSWNQRAKKVVSESPELVDFANGLVKSFEEFKSQKNCEINSAHQNIFRLVEMTFGLVYACFSLPEWQALKMTFLHPGTVLPTWNVPPSCIHYQNHSTSSPGLLG